MGKEKSQRSEIRRSVFLHTLHPERVGGVVRNEAERNCRFLFFFLDVHLFLYYLIYF